MTDLTKDPVIKAIEEAKTDEEVRRIEAEHLVQTDNRPKKGDPTQPEENDGDS